MLAFKNKVGGERSWLQVTMTFESLEWVELGKRILFTVL